jgi:hypothetical protein
MENKYTGYKLIKVPLRFYTEPVNEAAYKKVLDLVETKCSVVKCASLSDRLDSIEESVSGSSNSLSKIAEDAAIANGAAQLARDLSREAKEAAESVEGTANEAKVIAEDAKSTADVARTTSITTKAIAKDAKSIAEGIDSKAEEAKTIANEAKATANEAKTTAEGIDAKAEEALALANKAMDGACDCEDINTRIDQNRDQAASAMTTATGAYNLANDAKAAADKAQEDATRAFSKGLSAWNLADEAKRDLEDVKQTADDAKFISHENEVFVADHKDDIIALGTNYKQSMIVKYSGDDGYSALLSGDTNVFTKSNTECVYIYAKGVRINSHHYKLYFSAMFAKFGKIELDLYHSKFHMALFVDEVLSQLGESFPPANGSNVCWTTTGSGVVTIPYSADIGFGSINSEDTFPLKVDFASDGSNYVVSADYEAVVETTVDKDYSNPTFFFDIDYMLHV